MLKNLKSILTKAVTMLLILIVIAVPNASVNALASAGNSIAPCGQGDLTLSAPVVHKNGIDVLTFTDKQGEQARVAVKKFSGFMYFWYIQNDNDLANLLASPEVLTLQPPSKLPDVGGLNTNVEPNSAIVNGSAGLPYGGWVYWANGTIIIYISHDLASYWIAGASITALICAVIAVIPYGLVPGTLCAFVWGLTAAAISYYDSAGNPGFYIYANSSRVWIVP
jgi:hypothetical protein